MLPDNWYGTLPADVGKSAIEFAHFLHLLICSYQISNRLIIRIICNHNTVAHMSYLREKYENLDDIRSDPLVIGSEL